MRRSRSTRAPTSSAGNAISSRSTWACTSCLASVRTEIMLGDAPFDDLKAYLDRWARVRMSCEPSDRNLAEEGIRSTYAAAGLAPPDCIVWCGGPMEIAKRLATASPEDPIGANVKAEVFDRVRDKVGTLAEIFWKEVVIAAVDLSQNGTVRAALSEHNRCRDASKAVTRAVVGAVD